MKKLGMFIFVSILSIIGFASAKGFDLWSVDLNFCNAQNQLHIQTAAGTQTGFCMVFNNISNVTWLIQVNLVDGEMSVGENPVKACKTTTDGYFPKFAILSGMATGNIIVLPPNTGIVQRANVQIPNGFMGILNGCVAYSTVNQDSGSNGMFQIVNRKANIVDVTVNGAYVNNFWFMDMKTYSGEDWKLDQGRLILSQDTPILVTQWQDKDVVVVGLANTGFINEDYTVSWTIYNSFLGIKLYKKSFVIWSGTLYGQGKVVIEHLLDSLPFYKGKYHIAITLAHVPSAVSWMSLPTDLMISSQTISIGVAPDMYTFVYIIWFLVVAYGLFRLVKFLKTKKISIKIQ